MPSGSKSESGRSFRIRTTPGLGGSPSRAPQPATQCHEAASIFTGYFDTVGISHSDVPRLTTRESVSRAGG